MRRARTDRLAVATLLAALSGCGEDAREITVGVHHLGIQVPGGWEYVDHGLEHALRKDFARIIIQDLGVATRSGYLEEIETARELWRRGLPDSAAEHVRRLPVPRAAGYTRAERRELKALWSMLTSMPVLADRPRAEQAYLRVLEAITYLPDPRLEDVVKRTFAALGQSERRRIATQERIAVSGRSALQVDTWDWLSHGHRKRFALLFNRGRLLVIWTRSGRFEEVQQAHSQLVDSLQLRDQPLPTEHGSTGP